MFGPVPSWSPFVSITINRIAHGTCGGGGRLAAAGGAVPILTCGLGVVDPDPRVPHEIGMEVTYGEVVNCEVWWTVSDARYSDWISANRLQVIPDRKCAGGEEPTIRGEKWLCY